VSQGSLDAAATASELPPTTPSPLRIALIEGDGIGPELVDSALRVMTAAGRSVGVHLATTVEPGGAGTYLETGEAMPADALERLGRDYDAILKGPVGLPEVRRPDGTEAGLLGGILRIGLDTFANVRPIRLLPGVRTPVTHRPGDIDYVIVRENTEGLYLSRGIGISTANASVDQLMVTREGCERIARHAFEVARQRTGAPADGVRRVTCVDKSNVLRSFAMFRRIFDEVGEQYPDIERDYRYSDAAAHDLVVTPQHFDVIVTENFLGDLLSDLGAATVGGLGMCGSGNIGTGVSYFEPIHGSAPTIAGQGRANPTSQILSAAMLLRSCGVPLAAALIEDAVVSAFAEGAVSLTERGEPVHGTEHVTRTILERIGTRAANSTHEGSSPDVAAR
jgi:3-isopropylmalate dehydrogenase